MFVVSAPLDTRLLLCGLMQPHAIKQKSHGVQRRGRGGGLLSRHTGRQHRHLTGPGGGGAPVLPGGSILGRDLFALALPRLQFQHPEGGAALLAGFVAIHPSIQQTLTPSLLQLYTPVPGRPPETQTRLNEGGS